MCSLVAFGFLFCQAPTANAQVTGSGTINQIPKWSPTQTALANSAIADVNGNIGIGTTSPKQLLDVAGNIRFGNHDTSNSRFMGWTINDTFSSTNFSGMEIEPVAVGGNYSENVHFGTHYYAVGAGRRMTIRYDGNVGIGTTNPGHKLDVYGPAASIRVGSSSDFAHGVIVTPEGVFERAYLFTTGGNANHSGHLRLSNGNSDITWADILMRNAAGTTVNYITNVGNSYFNGGNVGIGTASPQAKLHVVGTVATGALTVNGDITATGNVAAKYQDLAEWVPASHAIPAGTVVVVDAEQSNHVLASSRAYDTRVAGVVSANPGVILGEKGEGKVMVATTGRVMVKVDASKGRIRVGDLLVTSDKEGIAMRSQPLDLGGTPIHRPGTLIGKALEPLTKGVGEILVLLSLQ
jgi:putative heme iron utilization protein